MSVWDGAVKMWWQWRAVGKGWGSGDVGIGWSRCSGGRKLSKAAKLLLTGTDILCVLDGFVTVEVVHT